MGSLVLGPVRAVAEGLRAAEVRAIVGSLARVGTLVNLEVFQSGECFLAAGELE